MLEDVGVGDPPLGTTESSPSAASRRRCEVPKSDRAPAIAERVPTVRDQHQRHRIHRLNQRHQLQQLPGPKAA